MPSPSAAKLTTPAAAKTEARVRYAWAHCSREAKTATASQQTLVWRLWGTIITLQLASCLRNSDVPTEKTQPRYSSDSDGQV